MLKKTLVLAGALVLIAAACGDDDEPQATPTTTAPTTAVPTTAAPATTPAPTTAAPAATEAPEPMDGPTVEVAASNLGDILVDADGNTLYLFQPDNAGPSVCTDACADAWPPLIGEPSAGDGVDAALLGTAERPDGSTQATYNSWPLYYFANDQAPGDTNGQGINDVWWVISPTGEAITAAAEAPEPMDGPTVEVAASDLGDILVDADGNTLYLFQPDNAGPSVCTDACADAWPPLIGEPSAGDGVDAALLGTAERPDGSTQATYNSWPLYYFANDQAPGDTNGQGINDVWWVISPTGEAITAAAEASAEPSPYG